MNNNLYSDAISRFKEGKYEEALAILNASKDHLSLKEKELMNECKRLVIEQYYYLINESIQQEDYQNARALKDEYKAKFGVSSRIDSIVVPEKSSVTSSQQIEQDDDEEESYGTRFWIIIAGIVVIGLIALFCWKHNSNKEATNTVIGQENTVIGASTNQFEYINKKRGNYEVDIEFPVSLAGMENVSGIQLAIAQKAFNCNSNDINSCVEKYFKEEAESSSLGVGETAGKVTVKFQQRLNSLYVFKINTYADLGGGTGLSVIYRDEYIYFDKDLNRSLVIDDLFTDYSQTLSLINEHISLDEYANKAEKLPENFIISSSGITFIFPKYSIGYGFQGEVEIALTYEELNNVLSSTFKNAIGK